MAGHFYSTYDPYDYDSFNRSDFGPASVRPRFNEIDYNQFGGDNQRREMERKLKELERTMRDREQQIRRDEFEIEQRRYQGYFDSIDMSSKKSKKDSIIEKFAVKFCFFRNKITALQTHMAMGILNVSTKHIDGTKLMSSVFDLIMKESSRSGISRKEISNAIKKMSTEKTEAEMYDMFVNNFLGSVAVNVFKANPEIIKNKKPSTETETKELTTENVIRMIRDLTEERTREISDEHIQEVGKNTYGDFIRDCPSSLIESKTPTTTIEVNRFNDLDSFDLDSFMQKFLKAGNRY